ncbi:MAG: P1 family peptidase [Pseudomonadota bacterium]
MKAGPKNLLTDIEGLRVGNAQDQRLKSGVTVVCADRPFTASVHVMGGAPGSRETDLLAPDKTVPAVDALVLSGGSAFGLAACDGVMEGLRQAGRGFAVGPALVPIVPGAILFDLVNGGDKAWDDNPYPRLGNNALNAASDAFDLGSVGAGTGALDSMVKGGLGSASLELDNGTRVAALMAVNPVGSATTPGARYFWAAPYELDGEFGGLGPDPRSGLVAPQVSRKMRLILQASQDAGGGRSARGSSDRGLQQDSMNTTIGIVATDASLTKAQCHRVSIAAHDGIARAIQPAHSPHDGDLLFALSTGSNAPVDDAELVQIGHAAAVCVARAIARGVFEATPQAADLLPTWKEQNRTVGAGS